MEQKYLNLQAKARWLILALSIVVLDQISKHLIASYFTTENNLSVLPFLNLVFTVNRGAAFSFLARASGWQEWFLVAVALVVSLIIIRWLFLSRDLTCLTRLALMLVLGGAVGNLIDRLKFGYVRDFIDFYWREYHFATFNIADSAISIGALILLLDIFWLSKNRAGSKRVGS